VKHNDPMTPQEQQFWAAFAAAALSGMAAAETEEWNHGHKADLAKAACVAADFMLLELRRRTGDAKL
jgi:hypothetical protein